MIVLALSDSHGINENVEKAIKLTKKKYGKIDKLLHMGDIETNPDLIRQMAGCDTYIVAGNCDHDPSLPKHITLELNGLKVLMTHGHGEQVNYGYKRLGLMGQLNHMDLVLFGHTHYPYLDRDTVTLLNPGSISLPRQEGREKTFVVLEISEDGQFEHHWENI